MFPLTPAEEGIRRNRAGVLHEAKEDLDRGIITGQEYLDICKQLDKDVKAEHDRLNPFKPAPKPVSQKKGRR